MKNLKEPIKNNTENSKIESNLSNDRTRHDGDNPSILDEFIKFTSSLTVQFIFVFLSKMKEGELDIPSHFYFSST